MIFSLIISNDIWCSAFLSVIYASFPKVYIRTGYTVLGIGKRIFLCYLSVSSSWHSPYCFKGRKRKSDFKVQSQMISWIYLRCGPLIDLCRGPHVRHTGKIKAMQVTKVYTKSNNSGWSVMCCDPLEYFVFLFNFRTLLHTGKEIVRQNLFRDFMESHSQMINR